MLAVLALATIAAAPPPVLTVEIANVRNATGLIHVDLCREETFLKEDCAFSAQAPARAGVTTLVFRGVPPGRYAAQASHDENGNRKVDRAMFGIPKEGVGFSRDARISFGPPRFADAAVEVTGRPQLIRFALRYFLGPSGPPRVR